jgi:hypothetical protein
LIELVQLRAAERYWCPGAAPKAVLSGIMALLLLVAATLSVNHTLHRSLHNDGSVSGHFCLVCSFAKGQANSPDVPLVLALCVVFVLFCIRIAEISFLPGGFDYRLTYGRAPPVR